MTTTDLMNHAKANLSTANYMKLELSMTIDKVSTVKVLKATVHNNKQDVWGNSKQALVTIDKALVRYINS